MKCILDANILIDLNNGGILRQLFTLPLDILAPDVVLDELTEPDRVTLQHHGLDVVPLSPTQLIEAAQTQAENPRLSLGDCTALITARDQRATLLTGDKRLRDQAEALSVATHGVLWILDELEMAGVLSGAELAISLRSMLTKGARLPHTECETRLQRWTGAT